jgi:flagellar biosynthetic protein FlhB
MSHQEVKQEHKEVGRQPEVKGKMRARMREIAKRRMRGRRAQGRPGGDEPDPLCRGAQVRRKKMAAPQVVAKGADLLAMKIREIAKHIAGAGAAVADAGARAVRPCRARPRDPAALFTAVAQVLAYVYRLKAAMRGEGPMPDTRPALRATRAGPAAARPVLAEEEVTNERLMHPTASAGSHQPRITRR